MRKSLLWIALVLLPSLTPTMAFAWRGDIRHFHEHDIRLWRSGRWIHGWHSGRMGWWWYAAGSWYFYTRPLYPYPDPLVPQTVIIQPQAAPPPAQNSQQSPPPPMPQVWYHCNQPEGYYPYVASCPSGWTQVPTSAPPPPPPPR